MGGLLVGSFDTNIRAYRFAEAGTGVRYLFDEIDICTYSVKYFILQNLHQTSENKMISCNAGNVAESVSKWK